MNPDVAAALAALHHAATAEGSRWRNDTPQRIVTAVDEVLRAWRKAQR